jgi:hypothetical protein
MKIALTVLAATSVLTSIALAQSGSPASTSSKSASTSPSLAARTDVYHVHFAKAALGKAAELGESFKKQAPDAPMPGHFIVLRHEDGDSWDYCVIEHLGTKATIDATRPAPSPSQIGLGDWHTDTICNGPSWAQFAKEMGIEEPSKSGGSAYVVSVYRPAPGMREELDKFVNQAPDRATDSTSGNIVLQHMEGAAWTFLKISRNNNWNDFAKDQIASIAQMNKGDTGWFKLRNLVSFHTDTLCDRMTP